MVSSILVSTVATGALLVGVAVFLGAFRKWRHDKPDDEASGFDAIGAAVKNPKVWIAAYVVGMVVAAGGVYVALGGAGVPEQIANAGIMFLGAVLGLAILVFVGSGTYTAVRGNGRSSAQAAGMGAAAIGFMLLAAIAVKLVAA